LQMKQSDEGTITQAEYMYTYMGTQ
jgi:hypothetical protein